MDVTLSTIDAEVQRLANEMTPELLPRLLAQLLKRDALDFCERHQRLLFPYVRAQIKLTHAKRNFYRYDNFHAACDAGERASYAAFCTAKGERDRIRDQYRSTPCTCYVHHR
jgi:hypothetical protein